MRRNSEKINSRQQIHTFERRKFVNLKLMTDRVGVLGSEWH